MKKLLLLTFFMTVLLGKSIGQTFTNNLPVKEIAGTGTTIPSTYVLQQIPIGFSFNFYGNAYTDVYLSPNGYLRFGTGLAGTSPLSAFPMYYAYYYATYRNIIAFAFGDYVKPGTYGTPILNYFTTGTAPNRVLVINFKGVSLDATPLATDPDAIINLQLQLFEGSNTVEVHNTKNKSFGSGFTSNRTFGTSNMTGTIYPALSGYDYVDRKSVV